jgi:hypothetical protein
MLGQAGKNIGPLMGGVVGCLEALLACHPPPCGPASTAPVVSQTIIVPPGGSPCAADEYPAPCQPGDAIDLVTGCCSPPGNTLTIHPAT